MAPERAGGLAGGRRPAGDVDPVQRSAPERETEQDRGRLVADDGGATEVGQGGRDQEGVSGHCRRGELSVQVGAPPDAGP